MAQKVPHPTRWPTAAEVMPPAPFGHPVPGYRGHKCIIRAGANDAVRGEEEASATQSRLPPACHTQDKSWRLAYIEMLGRAPKVPQENGLGHHQCLFGAYRRISGA